MNKAYIVIFKDAFGHPQHVDRIIAEDTTELDAILHHEMEHMIHAAHSYDVLYTVMVSDIEG